MRSKKLANFFTKGLSEPALEFLLSLSSYFEQVPLSDWFASLCKFEEVIIDQNWPINRSVTLIVLSRQPSRPFDGNGRNERGGVSYYVLSTFPSCWRVVPLLNLALLITNHIVKGFCSGVYLLWEKERSVVNKWWSTRCL